MKFTVLGGLGFALSVTPALAADIGIDVVPMAPAQAQWMSPFNGFYAGASVGYSWNDVDVVAEQVVGPIFIIDIANGTLASRDDYSMSGLLGGFQAGYDMAIDNFVVGVVGDFSWTDLDEQEPYTAVDLFLFPGALTFTVFETEIDWLATARVRAGVTYDNTLFYATGGLAFGEVENGLSVAIPAVGYAPAPWRSSSVQTGWTIGAGIEHAFTEQFSVQLEYLHYDLGDETVRAADNFTFPGQYIDYNFTNSGDLVRVGLNFRM